MRTSVIITSRNRCDDLRRTLRVLRRLNPLPHEVLVTLDGCNDNSAGMIAAEFPSVRLFDNPVGVGSVPARDHLMREATGDLVLSLDDDSYPQAADFVARASRFFAEDEQLAVLWFPQRSEEFPASLTQTDFGPDCWTASYSSSGAVLRRATFLALGGYATLFGHAYEEPDYALRCHAAGHRVRFHTGLLVRHHYSGVNRNEIRTHHLHSRNEAWSVLMRCPAPWWPLVLMGKLAGQLRYAFRRGPEWVRREPRWWIECGRGCRRAWARRTPIAVRSYRDWLRLSRQPTLA